jgi:hypothetical protein
VAAKRHDSAGKAEIALITTQKNTLLRAGDSSVVVVVDTRNIFSTSPASRANGKEISVEAAALPIELQKAG